MGSSTDGSLVGPVEPPDLHVMSFNIRRPADGLTWPGADRWHHRVAPVKALLAAERPDVLCLQEAVPRQMRVVSAALGPRWRSVGYGRGRRRTGEGCPIVFDTARLDLLRWRQHALSDRPDRPGSRSWGNVIPRIAVVARFRDRASGAVFEVMNTHLDPFSRRSRVRAVGYLRSIIGSLPTIVTGDMNAGDGSTTMRAWLDDGRVVDTWTAGERVSNEVGTYGGYRVPRSGGARIDRILVTPGVRVERAAIDARTFDEAWPSDHLPVRAVVRVPGAGSGPGVSRSAGVAAAARDGSELVR
jgi:endonuclease/exonuclease/phosphatase family metal-dependent hydrolase